MAVCMECGIENKPTRLPLKEGFIGWIGICRFCKRAKKVFADKDFGINPEVDNQVLKSHDYHKQGG